MKILYIGPIPPENGGIKSGGVATYCWELANQAQKAGFEVAILTHLKKEPVQSPIHIIGWPHHNILQKIFIGFYEMSRSGRIKDWRGYLRLRDWLIVYYKRYILRSLLSKIKPHIVHVGQLLDPATISLGLIQPCPPIVVTDHGIGMAIEGGLQKEYGVSSDYNKTFRQILKSVDKVVCVSNFARESLLRLVGEDNGGENFAQKARAILNPIDVEKFLFLKREHAKQALNLQDKPVILFVGVHLPFEKKGLGILLEAFSVDDYLRQQAIALIISDANTCSKVEEIAQQYGINALTVEAVSRTVLSSYYNAADVFVMPSKLEGIGLAYSEALLAGVPIVGFHKSVEELQSQLGLYIGEKFDANVEGPVELAQKIRHVLERKIDRESLRRAVVEHLSWGVKFKEYEELYRHLTSKARS